MLSTVADHNDTVLQTTAAGNLSQDSMLQDKNSRAKTVGQKFMCFVRNQLILLDYFSYIHICMYV